jgi:hypothetical protein
MELNLLPRGRKKLFAERITLPVAAEMLEAVDRSLEPNETRLDFIRAAIAKETDSRRKDRVICSRHKI